MLKGKGNPMYKTSLYNIWNKKYDKETAKLKINEYNNKLSKKSSGKNNGMYGRCGSKNPNYNIGYYLWWVGKYGKQIADEKYNNLIKKFSESRQGEKHPMYKKNHSIEAIKKMRKPKSDIAKKNMRISAIKQVQRIIGERLKPSYNSDACKFIDNYNKKYHYNFQHAENGGEVCIDGYFPDGCDEKRKTLIEIDEKHHYDANGNLRQKDIKR